MLKPIEMSENFLQLQPDPRYLVVDKDDGETGVERQRWRVRFEFSATWQKSVRRMQIRLLQFLTLDGGRWSLHDGLRFAMP